MQEGNKRVHQFQIKYCSIKDYIEQMIALSTRNGSLKKVKVFRRNSLLYERIFTKLVPLRSCWIVANNMSMEFFWHPGPVNKSMWEFIFPSSKYTPWVLVGILAARIFFLKIKFSWNRSFHQTSEHTSAFSFQTWCQWPWTCFWLYNNNMPCFCLKSLPFWYKEKRANFIFMRSCLIVVAPKSVLPSSSALRVLSCLQAINPWLKIIVTYFAGLLGIHALRTNNFEFQTWKPGFQTRRKSNIIYFPQGFIAIANAKDVIIANKIPIYRSVPSKKCISILNSTIHIWIIATCK